MKKNKKTIFIVISILMLLLIGVLLILLISPKNKLNSSKKVNGLVITDSKIDFNSSISVSFLSAKVKNNSKELKEDIKLKITFLNKSKKEITTVTGFVGDIDSKQTLELNAAVSNELKDVYEIKYEIIKQ